MTERLSPAVAHGQALLRTTSQSGLRPPAPLVGEPLACRSGSRGTREVFRIGNSSALLSRSTDADLCSKARHFMPNQTFSGQLKVSRSANGSPSGGNGDDRRQRRKQGGAVGAAASRMRATAKQTLGAATRPWRAKARLRGLFCKNPLQTSPRCGIIHFAASPLRIEYLPL